MRPWIRVSLAVFLFSVPESHENVNQQTPSELGFTFRRGHHHTMELKITFLTKCVI